MPNLPRSIDVWVCPACERAHSHQAGQTASICGCTGWDAAGVQRVRATYVLSAVSEEMVERAAREIHRAFCNCAASEFESGRYQWCESIYVVAAEEALRAAFRTEARDA